MPTSGAQEHGHCTFSLAWGKLSHRWRWFGFHFFHCWFVRSPQLAVLEKGKKYRKPKKRTKSLSGPGTRVLTGIIIIVTYKQFGHLTLAMVETFLPLPLTRTQADQLGHSELEAKKKRSKPTWPINGDD